MTYLVLSNVLQLSIMLLSLIISSVSGHKLCTNTGLQSVSHTARYELLLSKNDSLRGNSLAQLHLIPHDDQAWSSLMPRKMLMENDEFSWNIIYRKMKSYDGLRGNGDEFLKEVSLHDVRLDPSSIHGTAQQTNLEYLMMLEVDRLVWSFRKTAGLETPGEAYGGWEAPDGELRGHFVGHYLSATAQMWASTHNDDLYQKMISLVSALSDCQTKIGTGYLSAFPTELFDRFEALQEVWAPYYTIHKIMAGLFDQFMLAGNERALDMLKWMAEYFYNRVQNVISKYTIERHWLSLNEETGGMNDVLYKLYTVTGDQKHMLLAHLFDKPCFLGLLALKADDISGFHANTHIPIVVGSQLRYEITGEPLYKEMGTFFMDIVNSSYSYATGGTSVSEFWTDPKRLASKLTTENEESCTTYNMLKVSRYLFRWTKEMAYADYNERALTNGVLSIQRGTDPGVMIYMLPLRPGGSKAQSYHGWGTEFDSFWCCYGTGIESFSKLGDSIYFEKEGKDPGVYIIQYISSSFNWKSRQVLLRQKVDPILSWDNRLNVTLTISSNTQANGDPSSSLNLRIPLWTQSNGAKASLNNQNLPLPAPGNFLSVKRSWKEGDVITLELPMILRAEAIKDDRPEYAGIYAFLYGPYLLAGFSNGDWDMKMGSSTPLYDSITPVPAEYSSHLITLEQEYENTTFVLTNSDRNLTMDQLPDSGTDPALQSTFRLVSSGNLTSRKDVIGQQVMLEPFNFPGMLVSHDEQGDNLRVSDSDGKNDGSVVFNMVAGIDGKDGTVSLESGNRKGCFIYGGADVKLNCSSGARDVGFKQATSFMLRDGMAQYHPISFFAKGANRNFVLSPLLSIRDESYTVYFNASPSV